MLVYTIQCPQLQRIAISLGFRQLHTGQHPHSIFIAMQVGVSKQIWQNMLGNRRDKCLCQCPILIFMHSNTSGCIYNKHGNNVVVQLNVLEIDHVVSTMLTTAFFSTSCVATVASTGVALHCVCTVGLSVAGVCALNTLIHICEY